jgi:hypothetical protein
MDGIETADQNFDPLYLFLAKKNPAADVPTLAAQFALARRSVPLANVETYQCYEA